MRSGVESRYDRGMWRCLAALCVSMLSCATPAERVDQRAAEYGFIRHEVAGVGFVHAIYQHGRLTGAERIHVYIAGDGAPSAAARYDPPDPTPCHVA